MEAHDYVKTSKCKDIFAKVYTPNWSKGIFVITKVRNTVPRTDVINDLNSKDTVGTFYEKENKNHSEFRIEK